MCTLGLLRVVAQHAQPEGSGGTAKQKKKHYSRTAGGKVGDEDVEQILYGDDHLEME